MTAGRILRAGDASPDRALGPPSPAGCFHSGPVAPRGGPGAGRKPGCLCARSPGRWPLEASGFLRGSERVPLPLTSWTSTKWSKPLWKPIMLVASSGGGGASGGRLSGGGGNEAAGGRFAGALASATVWNLVAGQSSSSSRGRNPMHDRSGSVHHVDRLEVLPKENSLDSPNGSLNLNDAVKDEELKKCHRDITAPNKYNSQYHKLFKDIPTEESVLKVCSCALQRDILIQGRLYISPNWLCFYANLFGKDIKVVIPVDSVQLVKKHKTARLLPNGLAITTNAPRKYIFVSLISRDSIYDVLRRVCTHLQVSSKKSLGLKELTEEPDAVSLEVIVPEVKWRKGSSASLSLSVPDAGFQCIHRSSISNLSTKEKTCISEEPLASESTVNTEEELEVEQRCKADLRPTEYHLLKIFIVLICLLVFSSSYLAFRIFRLEQQLCSLNRDYLSREPQRSRLEAPVKPAIVFSCRPSQGSVRVAQVFERLARSSQVS